MRLFAHFANLTVGCALFWLPPVSQGQAILQTIKNFGDADRGGAESRATLIVGNDGALYGTTVTGGSNGVGTIFSVRPDGTEFTVLHHFGIDGNDGQYPWAGLLQGRDGMFYGTTGRGGANEHGAVFRLDADGTDYTVLYSFGDSEGDGEFPAAGVVQGRDGALYGTTAVGGIGGAGTIYRINMDGTGYTVLHNFDTIDFDGREPFAAVIQGQGQDDALYGTTRSGGRSGQGTVYKLDADGTGYAVIFSFSDEGGAVEDALVQGPDGALYGTSRGNGNGGVFKVNTDGADFRMLHVFSDGEGRNPLANLVLGGDGGLYGTTRESGGTDGFGTVFKLHPDGTGFAVIHNFNAIGSDGQHPLAALVQGAGAALYGTTINGGSSGGGVIYTIAADGSDYAVVHNFVGGDADGPYSALIKGCDGALYGTTFWGGSSGDGTVFKLNLDGSGYRVLHNFEAGFGDGWAPSASVMQASDGYLYGTTEYGGSDGVGTVFKLNTDGSGYGVLHSFSTNEDAGQYPQSAVVQGSNGTLYGTAASSGSYGDGAVFKLNTNGSDFTLLHTFEASNANNFAISPAGLLVGRDGALYGVITFGGSYGYGAIYRLSRDGTSYTVLHEFTNFFGTDGAYPSGTLVQGNDGTLYGMTSATVFQIKTNGTGFAVLHGVATGYYYSGFSPALVQDRDGALYGTSNDGTVFRIYPSGLTYEVIYTFSGGADAGQVPNGPLVVGGDGALYGTTPAGGPFRSGTAFRLKEERISLSNVHFNGSAFSFQFNGQSNIVYQVQFKSRVVISGWTPLATLTGQGDVLTFTNHPFTSSGFYRVVTVP